MKRYLRPGIIIGVVCCLALLPSLIEEKKEPLPFFLGGIQVNEPDVRKWVSTLDTIGMNTVSVTVYAKQGNWDSSHIWFEDEEPWVLKEIKAAKNQGLKVVLILRVALDHDYEKNKFLWHGMIMPREDKELDYWFKVYNAFVEKWAKVAEAESIDVLAIGSELRQLSATRKVDSIPPLIAFYADEEQKLWYQEKILQHANTIREKDLWVKGRENYEELQTFLKDEAALKHRWASSVAYLEEPNAVAKLNKRKDVLRKHWHKLIRKTRKHYSGPLTYAANFDNYQNIDFWDKLDFIGINAYFPLRDYRLSDINKERQFDQSWQAIYNDIDQFRSDLELGKKPVIFTEIGYVYREGTTIEPWSGFGFSVLGNVTSNKLIVWNEQAINYEERAAAMASLYRVHRERPDVLKGILYWKLTTVESHIEIEPFVMHLTPNGKDPMQREILKFSK